MNNENAGAAFDENDLISVIVPIYNAGDYLAPALDSLLAQTHSNLEILCLNDGSTDGSLDTMRAYEQRDARIRVIDKPNEGYGATCNRGIAEARGTWVAILEPDDWVEPHMYADMLAQGARFASLGRIDIIKTPYWRITNPDTPQQRKMNCSFRRRVKPAQQPFLITDAPHLLEHHPSIWSALYRKDFLVKNDIRFHEIPGAGWADNPFLLDTLLRARGIVYLDEPYYCYREQTPESFHASTLRAPLMPFERWEDMADIIDALEVTDEGILRAHNSRGFTYRAEVAGVLEAEAASAEAEKAEAENEKAENTNTAHTEAAPAEPTQVAVLRKQVDEATAQMFTRMDANIVMNDPGISPADKTLFAEIRGLPAPHTNKLAYGVNLVGEGLYFLRNTGPVNTLKMTFSFLKR